jgi:hypothetical protein
MPVDVVRFVNVRLDERDASHSWIVGDEIEHRHPAATGTDLEHMHESEEFGPVRSQE